MDTIEIKIEIPEEYQNEEDPGTIDSVVYSHALEMVEDLAGHDVGKCTVVFTDTNGTAEAMTHEIP